MWAASGSGTITFLRSTFSADRKGLSLVWFGWTSGSECSAGRGNLFKIGSVSNIRMTLNSAAILDSIRAGFFGGGVSGNCSIPEISVDFRFRMEKLCFGIRGDEMAAAASSKSGVGSALFSGVLGVQPIALCAAAKICCVERASEGGEERDWSSASFDITTDVPRPVENPPLSVALGSSNPLTRFNPSSLIETAPPKPVEKPENPCDWATCDFVFSSASAEIFTEAPEPVEKPEKLCDGPTCDFVFSSASGEIFTAAPDPVEKPEKPCDWRPNDFVFSRASAEIVTDAPAPVEKPEKDVSPLTCSMGLSKLNLKGFF